MDKKKHVFVLDVDGTLTDGKMIYTSEGKRAKQFGPDDWSALELMQRYMKLHFISADKKGFPITQRRIEEECGYELDLVGGHGLDRWKFIRDKYDERWHVNFMGDGIFDAVPLQHADFGITTADALDYVQSCANYVTKHTGGNRAVAEACLKIIYVFGFEKWDWNP